jgi:hypothetical protein
VTVGLQNKADREEPVPGARRRWAWRDLGVVLEDPRAPLVVLGAMMIISAVVFIHAGRGTTFWFDEWNFVQDRHEWTLDAFLKPHNEHFSLIPVAVYKLLFVTVGLDDYRVYRGVAVLFHLVCVGVLFVFARRRAGDWIAVALVAPLLFLASGWLDIVWPFQIGFLSAIACGVASLMMLEGRTRRSDVWACVLLALALASSSLGVPFALGAVFEVVRHRDRRARAWIVAVPIALYALWYVAYGHSALRSSNIDAVPVYVANAAAGAAGALSGFGSDWGQILVALLAVAVTSAWLRSTRWYDWLATVLVVALSFWALTGLARAQLNEPAAIRYLYPGAVLLILVLAELLRRARSAAWPAGRVVAICLFAAIAVDANIAALPGVGFLRTAAANVRAELTAVEIAAPAAAPDIVLDPSQPQIRPPAYLAAVRDLDSSPAYSQRELERGTPGARATADAAFLRIYQPGLSASPSGQARGPRPTMSGLTGGRLLARGSCVSIEGLADRATADLVVPPGGLVIEQRSGAKEAELRLRRFGDGFPKAATASLPSGERAALRLPRDRSPVPWHAQLTVAGPVRACGLAEGSG